MLEPKLVPFFKGAPRATILQTPAWGVILDCKDRQNYIYENLVSWARSATCVTSSYQYGTTNRTQLVGLIPSSAASSVDFTKTVTFPSTGLYRIEIEVYKGSQSSGSIQFYDGTTAIEDVKSLTYKYGHHERIVYPVKHYDSGDHNLKITLTRAGYVSNMYIYPIKRYTGGDVDHSLSEDILDVSKIEFTQNAHNDMDTCDIDMGLKSEYWNHVNSSLMEFGFTDSVTVVMGETHLDMEPVFGGYILGPIPSDDMSTVHLKCVNRFLDMMRVPTYHDFYVGTLSADAKSSGNKYISFASTYKITEYLANIINYPINTAGIPIDYGMNIDFSDAEQYNNIQPGGLKKYFDTGFGHPAPSVKLLPDINAGRFDCILWQGDQDIASYQIFNMDYHVSGAGAKYPLKFDLKFTMYKAGESINDARDYIVRFTGTDKQTNIIGTYNQDLITTWPSLNFNLKNLFDKAKTGASTEYNLVQISLVGTITPSQASHPLCSTIWIDQIYTYKTIENNPSYSSNGVKYPWDELQDVCNETFHVAYIVPGLERCDDILVLKPLEIAVTDEVLEDGEYGNVLEITSWNDDPVSDGYKNQANRTFNKSISTTATTPSNTYIENVDEVNLNGPFQDHEFWDNISSQAASDLKTQNYIDDMSRTRKSYTATIQGTTLIQPAHYIVANVVGNHIDSVDQIMNITQKLDIGNGMFTCTIDLNKPSRRFIKKIKGALDQINKSISRSGINTDYRTNVNEEIGTTSPGAFSEY